MKRMEQHKPVDIKSLKAPCKGYVGQAMGVIIGDVQFIVLAENAQALAAVHVAINKGKPGRPPSFNADATYPVAIIHKDNIVEDDEL